MTTATASVPAMEISLGGKVALVTGASKGIGKAIAAGLASSGARVMLSSRKLDQLEGAAAEMDGETAVFAANAGDPAAAEACVDATIERFGAVDILVNNAATNPYYGATLDVDEARFDKTFQVNVKGPLFWSHQVWEKSMKARPGVIVNIASVGGLRAEFGLGVYNVTKAALIHLTRQLAQELAPGVRVNAIAPAVVKTDFAKALYDGREEQVAATYPMKRLGRPADTSKLAAFLLSDEASWITGETVVVDGGLSSAS